MFVGVSVSLMCTPTPPQAYSNVPGGPSQVPLQDPGPGGFHHQPQHPPSMAAPPMLIQQQQQQPGLAPPTGVPTGPPGMPAYQQMMYQPPGGGMRVSVCHVAFVLQSGTIDIVTTPSHCSRHSTCLSWRSTQWQSTLPSIQLASCTCLTQCQG